MIPVEPQPDEAEALVRRFQRGDDAAFDRLVTLCEPRITTLLYLMLGNNEDADDALVELFVQLYQALPRFQWRSAFSTFLYGIAHNVCRKTLYRRNLHRKREIELETAIEDLSLASQLSPERPDEILMRKECAEATRALVRSISSANREVFILFELEGCTLQEISVILRLPLGTVKSRLSRARERFKTLAIQQMELFSALR